MYKKYRTWWVLTSKLHKISKLLNLSGRAASDSNNENYWTALLCSQEKDLLDSPISPLFRHVTLFSPVTSVAWGLLNARLPTTSERLPGSWGWPFLNATRTWNGLDLKSSPTEVVEMAYCLQSMTCSTHLILHYTLKHFWSLWFWEAWVREAIVFSHLQVQPMLRKCKEESFGLWSDRKNLLWLGLCHCPQQPRVHSRQVVLPTPSCPRCASYCCSMCITCCFNTDAVSVWATIAFCPGILSSFFVLLIKNFSSLCCHTICLVHLSKLILLSRKCSAR